MEKCLKKAPLSELDHYLRDPSAVFLIPDQSLSPSAMRLLKRERTQKTHFPLANIFYATELAKKILIKSFEKKQKGLNQWPETINYFEASKVIKRYFHKEAPLSELFSTLNQASTLLKYNQSHSTLLNILKEIEKDNAHLELKQQSKTFISLLNLLLHMEQEKQILNDWQLIPLACQALSENQTLNLTECLGQLLSESNELKLVVLSWGELLPLEKDLLTALSKNTELVFLKPKSSEEFLKASEFQEKSIKEISPETKHILWASFEDLPPANTTVQQFFQLDSVNHKSKKSSQNNALVRTFYQCLDYIHQNKSKTHTLHKDPSALGFLSKHSLRPEDLELEPLKTALFQTIEDEKIKELFQTNFECLQLEIPQNFLSAAKQFKIFPLEEHELNSETKKYLDERAISLIHLKDLNFIALNNKAFLFWGNKKEFFEKLYKQNSSFHKESPLSPQLIKIYESEGVAVPKRSHEIQNIKNILSEFKEKIHFLNEEKGLTIEREQSIDFSINAPTSEDTFSPSTIEAYKRCPLQYYYSRLCNLDKEEQWDTPNISPLRRGDWIHKSLEYYFKKHKVDELKKIPLCLEKTLEDSFQERSTQGFLDLMRQQIPSLSEKLQSYVELIEIPLNEIFPSRQMHHEGKHSASLEGFHLSGRIDRLDTLAQNTCFLWDYKTGNFNNRWKSLINNGKHQWLIYAAILIKNDYCVQGGAYINPLRLEHSKALFVLGNTSLDNDSRLQGVLERLNTEILSPLDFQTLLEESLEEVQSIVKGIQKGCFPAAPLKPAHCRTCSFQDLCGRSYYYSEENFS